MQKFHQNPFLEASWASRRMQMSRVARARGEEATDRQPTESVSSAGWPMSTGTLQSVTAHRLVLRDLRSAYLSQGIALSYPMVPKQIDHNHLPHDFKYLRCPNNCENLRQSIETRSKIHRKSKENVRATNIQGGVFSSYIFFFCKHIL